MKTTLYIATITTSEDQTVYQNFSLLGLLNELSEAYDQKFHNEDEFLDYIEEIHNAGTEDNEIAQAYFHDLELELN